jgi:HemY protein
MARILTYIVAVALLVAGAVWLADRPGLVTVEWLGWRIEISTGVALILLAVVVVLLVTIIRLWDLIWRAPRRLLHVRAERRRAAGYRALTKGMVAVAAGDAAEAKRQARSAHGLLKDPPLTLLLAAQAAQLNGDDYAARRYFTAMLERSDMRFLGLRGLLNQALARGDDRTALELARRARRERPDAAWPVEALIDLQIRLVEWSGTADTINAAVKQKLIAKPDAKRQLAAVFLEEARERQESDPARALELAQEAHKRRPTLVPAIQLEASLLQRSGRTKEAKKLIEQAWGSTEPGPHPLLAASYAGLEPAELPLARAHRFEALAAKAPQHRESRLALAETAIAAERWAPARAALEAVVAQEPAVGGSGARSARVCRLMAALEEGEKGDSIAARRWLAAATAGAPDPIWVCEACGTAHADWQARCPHCGGFDSIGWRASPPPPVRAIAAPAAGSASLPAARRAPAGTTDGVLTLDKPPSQPLDIATDRSLPDRPTWPARGQDEPAENSSPAPQVDAARRVN